MLKNLLEIGHVYSLNYKEEPVFIDCNGEISFLNVNEPFLVVDVKTTGDKLENIQVYNKILVDNKICIFSYAYDCEFHNNVKEFIKKII